MPIDNATWQARVGIFNSPKSLFKTETKNIGIAALFTPSYFIVYSLYLFLTFILITQVKSIPPSFHLGFLKIADLTLLLLFFIQN